MGVVLRGSCNCGFDSGELYVGGGMFREGCMAPAVCLDCHALLLLDYEQKKTNCPSCGGKVEFYNSRTLRKEGNGKIVFSWSTLSDKEFRLPSSNLLCPNCMQFEMQFEDVGDWD